jgi:hypothetical protein
VRGIDRGGAVVEVGSALRPLEQTARVMTGARQGPIPPAVGGTYLSERDLIVLPARVLLGRLFGRLVAE